MTVKRRRERESKDSQEVGSAHAAKIMSFTVCFLASSVRMVNYSSDLTHFGTFLHYVLRVFSQKLFGF